MKIHGIVYLVIGLAVAIASKVVDSQKLLLFIYVGIVMSIFGLVKIFLESRKKKPATNGHYVTHHSRVTQQQQFTQHYCRYCGALLNPQYAYCPRCHARV